MGKLLLLIIFAVLVYVLLTRGRRKAQAADRSSTGEAMAQCAHCGVHVPLSESIAGIDRRYCCEEHRRLAEK